MFLQYPPDPPPAREIPCMESTETNMCPRCVEMMATTEKCIRENPREALLASICAGFLIAQFPLGMVGAGILRLLRLTLKPAAILYGLMRMAEDCHCSHTEHRGSSS